MLAPAGAAGGGAATGASDGGLTDGASAAGADGGAAVLGGGEDGIGSAGAGAAFVGGAYILAAAGASFGGVFARKKDEGVAGVAEDGGDRLGDLDRGETAAGFTAEVSAGFTEGASATEAMSAPDVTGALGGSGGA